MHLSPPIPPPENGPAPEEELSREDRMLQRALRPMVESTLVDTLAKHQDRMAEALYPVIGRAVRKSVRESLRGLAESINHTMESALTFQWLRWRFESWRTGRPVPEIVLSKSLLYRVEEVFLIHDLTGLLLQHAATEQDLRDRDLVSGMLQAIQDFVADSFKQSSGASTLENFNVGDLNVWISHGPLAYLAVVIRGEAPAALHEHFDRVLEDIHQEFLGALTQFNGDDGPLAATDTHLENCLLSERRDVRAKPKPYFALFVVGVLAALGFLGWHWWSSRQRLRAMRQELANIPGVVVTRAASSWRGTPSFEVLRDPRAAEPREALARQFPQARYALAEAPFASADPALLIDVAERHFAAQDHLRWEMRAGRLTAVGQASGRWLRQAAEEARRAGLGDLDLGQVINRDLAACLAAAKEIAGQGIAFEPSQLTLAPTESGQWNRLVEALRAFPKLAQAAGVADTLVLYALAPNDPATESDLQIARQRTERVRARLLESGLAIERLEARDIPPASVAKELAGENKSLGRPKVIIVPSCLLSRKSPG